MVMGFEAVRNCDQADTSALHIDMDSGMLDSMFVSLNIDQNLFGFSWKLTSREENKFLRLDLTIFLKKKRYGNSTGCCAS
jgi:hypothetical protein